MYSEFLVIKELNAVSFLYYESLSTNYSFVCFIENPVSVLWL